MERRERLVLLIGVAVLMACTSYGPTPVPDAGEVGAADSLCQTTCGPDACGTISDGCGGTINCGSCTEFEEEPTEEPEDPMVACEDDGDEPDSAGAPLDFGSHDQGADIEDWSGTRILRGNDRDYFSIGAKDTGGFLGLGLNGNPKAGFAFRNEGDELLVGRIEVGCSDVSIKDCDGGVNQGSACGVEVEPGEKKTVIVNWDCGGILHDDETAILLAEVSVDCDGTCADTCLPYDVAGIVPD